MEMTADQAILTSAARVDAAAKFLQSPMLVAQIIEGMERAVIRAHSPWLTRKDAAAYAGCSASEIDRAGAAKVLRRYQRGGTPMYHRADIDDAILSGRWANKQQQPRKPTCLEQIQ